MLAHFIQIPFGLLIRDVLITDAIPVSKFRRLRRAQLHQICRGNATAKALCLRFATAALALDNSTSRDSLNGD
jgi:hypothetical protein